MLLTLFFETVGSIAVFEELTVTVVMVFLSKLVTTATIVIGVSSFPQSIWIELFWNFIEGGFLSKLHQA